jgi:ABC-type dipeptide/oligopeptide/nickel transport system permease subunit/ABC-type transport system substrate-binding protein
MTRRPAAPRSPLGEAWARFRRDRPAMLGLGLLAALGLFALLGPLVTPWGPDASDFTLTRGPLGAPPGPSAAHWLGTDAVFRDVFARLAHGARVSLGVGLAATAIATGIGAAVGVLAGMTEGTHLGILDTLAMRLVDVLLALPFLLFVTAIGVAVGRTDVGTVLLVLGGAGWTTAARLVRARTLQIRALDYVAAAHALGAGPLRVVFHHVLPNLVGPLVVVASAGMAQMILAEAVLGYLTVGIPPPHASWGRMLHEAEPYLATRFALLAIPGFTILLAVLGWNRVGDGLRDALAGGGRDGQRGSAVAKRGGLPVDLLLAGAALLLLSFATPNRVAPPLGAAPWREEPRRGGVFRGATFVNLRTLDPAIAFDEASSPLVQLVFARLVTWDAEGHVAPDLARSFTASPDGRTYTFELREGARFHDGSPVLARDVKRSLERLLHPRTPSPASSLYARIKGYTAFHGGKAPELAGVHVLGDHLLAVELDEPDATFLPKMTLGFAAPVCASAGDAAEAHGHAVPCGAGPFRVASWDPDKGVHLVRHEGYYAPGRPFLDGVEWSVSVPTTTQRYKFERGDLDYVTELGGADRDLYLAAPAWSPYGRWTMHAQTNAIFLNTEVPPFDRRDIRRAVAMAVDPSAAARMRADVIEADRVIPPSIPGPPRTEPMRRHDLPGALAAMARAGYAFDPATGRGGWPAPIDYLTIPDTGDQAYAEIWQQQLARVGLRIRLRLLTYASFLSESGRRHAAPMGRGGWSADYPDPSNFFEPILSTAAIQDEGSDNPAFFSSPELDGVLARAHDETSPPVRDALYLRAEEIIRDEAPWIPTHGTRSYELWQPYVHGYLPHPVLRQRFADLWLDRGGPAALALLPGLHPSFGRRP